MKDINENSLKKGKLKGLIISDKPELSSVMASLLSDAFDIDLETLNDLSEAIAKKEQKPITDFDLITIYGKEINETLIGYVNEVSKNPYHPSLILVVQEISKKAYHPDLNLFKGKRVYVVEENRIASLIPTIAEKAIWENPLSSSRVELLRNNILFEKTLNALPDIFAVVDITTKLLIWNRRLEDLTGYTSKELENMHVYDFIEESSMDLFWLGTTAMLEGKEGIADLLLVKKDGRVFAAELRGRAVRNDRGEIIGFSGTARDVTARSKKEKGLIERIERERQISGERATLLKELNTYLKSQVREREQIEKELRESRKFHSSILDNIRDYILVISRDGSLLYANPAARRYFGIEPGQFDLYNFRTYIHPEDLKLALKAWAQIIDTGSLSKPLELRIHQSDSSWRTLEIVGQRFQDTEGESKIIINSRDVTERKAAEEELREKSKTLRAFLDATSEVAVLFDSEKRIVTANKVLAERLGKNIDELLGARLYESGLLDPQVAKLREEKVDEVLQTGKPVKFEDFHRGTHFEHRLYPVFGKNGEVEKVAFFSTDITEHKKAEKEIRKFETIYERANFGISIVSLSEEILYVNPYFASVHGFNQEELKGKPVDILHSADQMPRVRELLDKLKKEGSFDAEVVWHAKKDGKRFPMLMNGILIRDENNQPSYMAATAIDITELTHAQEALKESEEKYRSYFENAFDVIIFVNSSFTVSSVSPSIENITGYKPEEIVGRNFTDLKVISPQSIERVINDLVRVISGEKITAEYLIYTKSGETKTIEVNESPLSSEGRIIGALCTARDITDRKEAEEELRRLNKELETYAQTVSHDLKRPLSAIKLSAENLIKIWAMRDNLSASEIDKDIVRAVEIIQEGVSKANALIDDLLSLAYAGQKPKDVEEIDIGLLVAEIINERNALISSRGAKVNHNRDLGIVVASPTHMYQIFSNLIENAIVHNPSEHPGVSIKYLGWDRVTGHHYIVQDNGPGIPPELTEAVFQPFFRGKNGKTGIGLAIVDKIVNLYGGNISIKNRNGAVFEFFIKDFTGR